jgi:hypothetical protein
LKASLPPCNKKDEGIGMSKMYDDEYFKDLGYIGDKNTRQLRRVTPEEITEERFIPTNYSLFECFGVILKSRNANFMDNKAIIFLQFTNSKIFNAEQ